jgi:type II secretory pathway component PulF
VLLRLADFQERQEQLRRTVTSAMAYPVLMAGGWQLRNAVSCLPL